MAYKALDVANELLKRAADNGGGDLLTNLKLQKMLYYEQGFHLAYFNEPLFEEPIEAWQYGPVVPVVYNYYKSRGRNGIEPEDIIEKFGADALRLFLISNTTLGEDIRFSLDKISYMSNFLNKVWNIHNLLNQYEFDAHLTKINNPLNK